MPIARRIASDIRFGSVLRRIMAQSRLYPAIEFGSLDVVQMTPGGDDFMGDTLRTDIYTVSNGGGASAADPVITGGALNGILDMVTGTAGGSTASSEICSGLNYRGDHGCIMVACLTLDIITGVKVEVGFTDVLNDPGAVNVKATPTFTADDCALWVLDTNDNDYWEGLAANNGSTLPMATVEAAISPVAATYEWLMVELIESDDANNQCAVAFSRFNAAGYRTYHAIGGGADPQGPNSNVLLTPWIYVEARNATSKILSVDYFNAWQFRANVQA